MKSSSREMMVDIAWIIAGNLFLAMGVAWFILPNNVLTGGLAGVAIALEPLLHIQPQLMINVLTVVLFVLGSFILGKKFAMKTILSTVLYPLLLSVMSYLVSDVIAPDTFIMDKYLATIYGGALMGIGIGCVFRTGASTGGMDIPPLIVNKYTHIPLPTLVLITDALTVLLGVFTYNLQAALTGILSVWVSSMLIDKTMMIGGHSAQSVMIISDNYEELMKKIHDQLERGTTILQAMGGFSKEKKPVIMVVVSKKQLPELQYMIAHEDPEAFVIVSETNEVQGLGFTYEEEL
ncbi:YitT family protein [[Eubacterium] hominis]|uniref:YitT family protein n=1 Tax=[Eubacterium] hominis TaxID=2764325 RepID=UPI003A4E0476